MKTIEISGMQYQVYNYSDKEKKSSYSDRTLLEMSFELDIEGVGENEKLLDLLRSNNKFQVKCVPEDAESKTMIKVSDSYSFEGRGESEFTNYHHTITIAELDPEQPKKKTLDELMVRSIGTTGRLIIENFVLSKTIKEILLRKNLITEDEYNQIYEEVYKDKRGDIADAVKEIYMEDLDRGDDTESD